MRGSSFNKGFGVVEIIVVAAIASAALLSIAQLTVLSTRPIDTSKREVQAAYLAQEGIEAVRVLRNESWSSNIDPLSNGTTYYPVTSGGAWTLSTSDPGKIDGVFTRTVQFAEVLRDGNDDIASSGSVDTNTRKVTAKVSWSDRGDTKDVQVQAYVTNFLEN